MQVDLLEDVIEKLNHSKDSKKNPNE